MSKYVNKYAIFMVDDDDKEGEGVFVWGIFNSEEEMREWVRSLPEDSGEDGWEKSPWYEHDTTFHFLRVEEEVGEAVRARELIKR